jgi:uncharacterized protein (UPF0210 family)
MNAIIATFQIHVEKRGISMAVPPIRTITLGIAQEHPLSAKVVARAAATLQEAGRRFSEAGYKVQTTRLSTRPVLADLAGWSPSALLQYARELQSALDEAGLDFCSVGTALAADPGFRLESLNVLADILIATDALSATVMLASATYGLRAEAALPAAQVMQRLARETAEGYGNFRFAMLACVDPGSPFFPTAYHAGPTSLTIGLQGAGIVADALKVSSGQTAHLRDLEQVSMQVKHAMLRAAQPVVELARKLTAEQGVLFGGIDLSPAPLGEESIAAALELCGYGLVGTPGTLAVAAAITAALKNIALPTCGYCGLMLPVLEDAVLGRRWEEGFVNAHQLLLYSAVCGTGLDTLPLPGAITTEEIAGLLLDVATLALRLNKPLSARLFPVPGKRAGERTEFSSQYLTNTTLRA